MSTQTEIAQNPKRQSTMPTSPRAEKKAGFFKRHLTVHRRRSSVSFPNASPPSPVTQSHPPKSAMRRASLTSQNGTNVPAATDAQDHAQDGGELTKVTSNGTAHSGEGLAQTGTKESKSSKTGVKWAAGFEEPQSPRPRRPSSPSRRRSSIYTRVDSGGYAEGVDAGVGSKARRLSVHIPDELEVDECPLEDHFSLFARLSKKDIGEGGAAVVRLMQSKSVGAGKKDKVFAVKEFREWEPEDETEPEYIRKIKSEYAIAKSCEHPNIVETYRLCYAEKKSHWYHVMEYCDQGDLNDIVKLGYFSREDRDCMFKQLLRGVEYLHSRGIAHRDLKSENLLLSKTGCLKIADFGTSEVFCGKHPGLRNCRRPSIIKEGDEMHFCRPGLVGSKPYMAPELLKREKDYDPRAVDIWSCAVVYLSLIVGGTPWTTASTDVNNFNIYCASWDRYEKRYPDSQIQKERPCPDFVRSKEFMALGDLGCRQLVFGMLHPDPSKRWSAHEALESQTVTEFPCCQQEGYSDDIRTRQRKALHNHLPPKKLKGVNTKAS